METSKIYPIKCAKRERALFRSCSGIIFHDNKVYSANTSKVKSGTDNYIFSIYYLGLSSTVWHQNLRLAGRQILFLFYRRFLFFQRFHLSSCLHFYLSRL